MWNCAHCENSEQDILKAMNHWVTVHPGSNIWPEKEA